ncbi:hypothetical protein PCANC_20386 [Puccinia coronata f. sp. avenae]|uniref:Uncharacterized protein n=1 Tax=Puccinia coronata f. sp. avenae TaxID=200324 RepID=A0A2N5UEN2_9BASI|nr:hypothetical protein PCANC_20386 [Puccinia coronata f. sp. avenae]
MSQLPSSIDPNLLPSLEMTPAPAQKKLDSELPKTNKNQIKPSMKEEDNNNKGLDSGTPEGRVLAMHACPARLT